MSTCSCSYPRSYVPLFSFHTIIVGTSLRKSKNFKYDLGLDQENNPKQNFNATSLLRPLPQNQTPFFTATQKQFSNFEMAPSLRTPTLTLSLLSICLSIAIIGTAGRSYYVFTTNHSSNPWFLPSWPDHFDLRELQTLMGTSAAVVVLNAVVVGCLFAAQVSGSWVADARPMCEETTRREMLADVR